MRQPIFILCSLFACFGFALFAAGITLVTHAHAPGASTFACIVLGSFISMMYIILCVVLLFQAWREREDVSQPVPTTEEYRDDE